MDPVVNAVTGWWFSPVPKARIAFFRLAAYLFIPLDVLLLHPISNDHASATALYQPLVVGDLLHLPRPTGLLIAVLQWGLIAMSLVAATGRLPRALGAAIFVFYFEWTVIAFSFGKVDHDRIAYLLALAVLPTVAKAALRDRTPSESAGWAIRCVQIGVVATYFLAAWAKLRFGGVEWVNSATLVRAVLRRGTILADPLLANPWTLHWAQWGIMALELGSPVILFVRPKVQQIMVVVLVGFHLSVFATITIMFWPHLLCLLCAFLPTERLFSDKAGQAALPGRWSGGRAQAAVPPGIR